ncbi:hypothetical protein BH10PSE6_BH10PSE6_10790 [soil metagenome]
MGLDAAFTGPRPGSSTSTMLPRAFACSLSIRSLTFWTAEQGMPAGSRTSKSASQVCWAKCSSIIGSRMARWVTRPSLVAKRAVRRIGMDRNGQHVGPLEEDALRAVAVMHVDVEDRDALVLAAQALRGDRRVVQEAEAAGHVGIGVMPGRPAEGISLARAVQHEVRSRGRHFGRRKGCVPGARANRAGKVDLMPAGASGQRLRVRRRISCRMDVGHDLGRGVGQLRPFPRDGLQEVDVFGRMDRRGRCRAVGARRNYLVPGVLCRREQARGPLGLLGAALLHATDEEGLRIVRGVLVGVDDLQARFFLKWAIVRSQDSLAAASW